MKPTPLLVTREEKKGGPATAPYRITLGYNRDTAAPWVTHCRNEQTDGLFWGHYFESFEAAIKDYLKRCREAGISPEPFVE